MNDKDRKELADARTQIDTAMGAIRGLAEAEQEKFENLSEGLQAAENGQKMEEAANALAEIADDLENILSAIDEV